MKSKASFRFIWLSSAISEFGGALFTACNSILIYEVTGSPSALGLVWLIYYIPSFFMQLFIGPYIDRWSRKWTMILCQLIRMVLATVLVVALFIDNFTIAFIYIIQIIVGLIMPIFTPANQAILPTIVEKEQLIKANASLESIRQVMAVMGPLLSGIFIDLLAIEWIVCIIATAFGISALLLINVKEEYKKITERNRWISEFREGLQSYFKHKLIVWLGVFFGFVQFGVGVTIVTTLPYITTILEEPYAAYGLFMAGFPIGYIFGAMINARLGTIKGIGLLFSTLFIGGCTYISLSITSWYSLALVTECIAGIAIAIFTIYNLTLIQRVIPNHVMGKVTSVRLLIMRTMLPAGILFATVAVQFYSIRTLYLVIGSIICITALIGYFYLSKQQVQVVESSGTKVTL
ncbi:MFS transporter [Caldibacillus lycopersici]|uniref:MFS transporter n=1 Tax=Perspicuibacillus lycopersici TaxID=1325689 RepID=A0AAE3IUY0_9BACI|nr:MFS transporter [Perspicuibacillus lycopersici]MCU9614917.1 MFS transporter [Perspicuibacillus lycopersici]